MASFNPNRIFGSNLIRTARAGSGRGSWSCARADAEAQAVSQNTVWFQSGTRIGSNFCAASLALHGHSTSGARSAGLTW
jgi:hypothetical protein